MNFKILVINPGSTSTKVAVFQNKEQIIRSNIQHPVEELGKYEHIWDQFKYRLNTIQLFLEQNNYSAGSFAAIVGRGGLLKSLPGGTYQVNSAMLSDAQKGLQGEHAANLGCILAHELAAPAGIPAFIVDPISVDEFEPLARYSGHPLVSRRSLSHTLNIHAAGREAARQLQLDYQTSNFIVAHLGGGISVCPLKGGRIIDVNDSSSDGPFSPERTGGLPLQPFMKLCFSDQYTQAEIKRLVMGEGGLTAYLGTNSAQEIETRIQNGDTQAKEIFEAMAYQIAKEIGAMATVLNGEVAAIAISGGLAGSERLINWIKPRVQFIAKTLIFPGEFELQALAGGAWRVLRGQEQALIY